MAVEFFAISSDGTAVADLKREELALKVSGRLRAIQTLQWIPMAEPTGLDLKPAVALPDPFGTNVLATDGRAVVLVLDDDSFSPGREGPLRGAVTAFLAGLSPRDRVALVTMPYGGLKVDFTAEHTRVARALSRIVGQGSRDQTGSDLACRSRLTLQALAGLLDSLAGGQGPTTILFVSSGLAAPRRDAAMALGPGMCELTTDHFAQVAAAASAARAHFYVVQPEDVLVQPSAALETIAGAGFRGSDNPLAGLEHLAGVTGGQQLPLLSARESNLSRVGRETTGYYLITFNPEPDERNGNRHVVDLRAARDGVAIRARPTITIPRRDGRTVRTKAAPRDMLREARVFRDLPLRAIAYASLNATGDKAVKILTAAEAVDPSVKLTAAAAGLFDANGRLTAQWTANADDLAATPAIAALVVPAGTYRLRVAATDAAGRGGTADYEVSAELTRLGALAISGLVLGLSRNGTFAPRLQFGAEPVGIGYLEIYGDVAEGQLSVTLEIAMSLSGPPLVRIPAAINATSDSARRMVTAAIPVGALPAGDFIIRAIVTAGADSVRVTRTLRKAP